VARTQKHEGKPAVVLAWTELLEDYAQAERDYGSDLGTDEDAQRAEELHAEITNRVMRAELAYPGCMKLLEGDAL
jgi:hypothetical protein